MSAALVAVDHVVIAVRDLDAACRRYSDLGFVVQPGGHHDGTGTSNALIPLGPSYLELLAVDDEQKVAAIGVLGISLLALLERADGAFAGFAAAAGPGARRALADDPGLVGPLEMRRTEPGGRNLRWNLLVPGGTPWRRLWPMVIEWLGPTPTDSSPRHPNGARELTELVLDVEDLEAAGRWYEHMGVPVVDGRALLGGASLRLRAAATSMGPGSLGSGPSEVSVAVTDLDETRALLGDAVVEVPGAGLLLPVTGGATIRFHAR